MRRHAGPRTERTSVGEVTAVLRRLNDPVITQAVATILQRVGMRAGVMRPQRPEPSAPFAVDEPHGVSFCDRHPWPEPHRHG